MARRAEPRRHQSIRTPHSSSSSLPEHLCRESGASAKTGPPDLFLHTLGSVRDLALHMIAIADWKLTLACLFGLLGRLARPWIPEDLLTQALLELFLMSFGVCFGKYLDRRFRVRRNK